MEALFSECREPWRWGACLGDKRFKQVYSHLKQCFICSKHSGYLLNKCLLTLGCLWGSSSMLGSWCGGLGQRCSLESRRVQRLLGWTPGAGYRRSCWPIPLGVFRDIGGALCLWILTYMWLQEFCTRNDGLVTSRLAFFQISFYLASSVFDSWVTHSVLTQCLPSISTGATCVDFPLPSVLQYSRFLVFWF